MCPDFRALNKLTIKDKFSILVLDDLLDELHGAKFFTKLELHSEYQQLRIKEANIPKLTFCTQDDHYDFLVMPFELGNSPSTSFQSLMNKILKPIHDVMLFFFDDFLIYNKT